MFGPRIIGQEAFEEQQRLVEEGRLHFGPRVLGEGALAKSIHGETIVGKPAAEKALAVAKAEGRPVDLGELKLAQLEEVADSLGIRYPKKAAKAKLIELIEAHEPVPGSAPAPEAPAATEPTEGTDEEE